MCGANAEAPRSTLRSSRHGWPGLTGSLVNELADRLRAPCNLQPEVIGR